MPAARPEFRVRRRPWKPVTDRNHLPLSLIRKTVDGIHLLHQEGGQWLVKAVGPKRIKRRFATKDRAEHFVVRIGQNLSRTVIVHNADGTFERIMHYSARTQNRRSRGARLDKSLASHGTGSGHL